LNICILKSTCFSGSIKDSALYREYPSQVYRHGQYDDVLHEQRVKSLAKNRVFYMDPADAEDPNAFDDFYSPIEPESYIRHRVLPQLHFYQSRCAGLLMPLIMMIIAVQSAAILCKARRVAGCSSRNFGQ
jgi:hypothetical protein